MGGTDETVEDDLRRVIAMLERDVFALRNKAAQAERDNEALRLELRGLDALRIDAVQALPDWAAAVGISASAAAALARKGALDVVQVGRTLFVLATARNQAYVPGRRGPVSTVRNRY
jgi:hypothetical protein